MQKFAISPTPPVPLPIKNLNNSLTKEVATAEVGPKIKPDSNMNTNEKSSCKKPALGKIGNSRNETTKDNAAKHAVPTIFFVVVIIKNTPLILKGRKKISI